MTMQKIAEALAHLKAHSALDVDCEIILNLIRAAQGEQSGWKLVPVEPTEAMLFAHDEAHARSAMVFANPEEIWRAMLAAAPSPNKIATPALPSESKDSGVTARRDGTPSDWEAGAIAMREACAKAFDDLIIRHEKQLEKTRTEGEISRHMRVLTSARSYANATRALPIPRCP